MRPIGPETPPDPKVVWEMLKSPLGIIVASTFSGFVAAEVMNSNILIGAAAGFAFGLFVVVNEALNPS